jgi:hypothetical protein
MKLGINIYVTLKNTTIIILQVAYTCLFTNIDKKAIASKTIKT